MAQLDHLPFRVSTLIFVQNSDNKFLLLKRNKSPNQGCWSPVGGKLLAEIGESPFECAIRETEEETGLVVKEKDLHLFGLVSEKSYEGEKHWLMFLFNCKKKIDKLPPKIDEGRFQFFSREEIESLTIPKTDHAILWKVYDRYSHAFVAMRAECHPHSDFKITYESVFEPESMSILNR